MAICKVLKPIHSFTELKGYLKYLQGKSIFKCNENSVFYSVECEPYTIIRSGINSSSCLSDEQAREIKMLHDLAGNSGTILAYHLVIDFNCELDPESAAQAGAKINKFWDQYNVAWVQGLHLYEADELYWPHIHVVVSSRIMAGSDVGKVLHIDKEILLQFKEYANAILKLYGASEIIIKKQNNHQYTTIPRYKYRPIKPLELGKS